MSYHSKEVDVEVVRLLRSGGVGLLPTDTTYGLSCRALDEQAVYRLRRLKDRSDHKPLIVLFSNYSQLRDLGMSAVGLGPAKHYWPGPLSVEWSADSSPKWLHPASSTFAIRMPNNKRLLDLISHVGPITSTSANPEGSKPAISVREAEKYFGERLDFYVDSGRLSGQPSTLVKPLFSRLKIIRRGAVKIRPEDLLK